MSYWTAARVLHEIQHHRTTRHYTATIILYSVFIVWVVESDYHLSCLCICGCAGIAVSRRCVKTTHIIINNNAAFYLKRRMTLHQLDSVVPNTPLKVVNLGGIHLWICNDGKKIVVVVDLVVTKVWYDGCRHLSTISRVTMTIITTMARGQFPRGFNENISD